MQIILAKTAGFCFGVTRAVKLTYELLEQGGGSGKQRCHYL